MLTTTDLLPEQTVWVGMTADGMVARTHDDKAPRPRGTRRAEVAGARQHDRHAVPGFDARHRRGGAVHTLPEAEKLSSGVLVPQGLAAAGERRAGGAVRAARQTLELPEETCVLTVTTRRHAQEDAGQRTARPLGADVHAGKRQRRRLRWAGWR